MQGGNLEITDIPQNFCLNVFINYELTKDLSKQKDSVMIPIYLDTSRQEIIGETYVKSNVKDISV